MSPTTTKTRTNCENERERKIIFRQKTWKLREREREIMKLFGVNRKTTFV